MTNAESQPRGTGWVVGQGVLFLLVVAAAVVGPHWPWHRALLIAGVVLGVLAAALFLGGIVALGNALTPFPRPRGMLVERGPFALVRHPIYGGVLLGLFAASLATSPLALAPAVCAVVFLTLKARHEERLLREVVPGYGAYCTRVRRRFIPFVL